MDEYLDWELVEWPFNPGMGKVWKAKVPRGYIYLHTFSRDHNPKIWNGIDYVSSFGASSPKSFSGFIPNVTMDMAKVLVLREAKKHW